MSTRTPRFLSGKNVSILVFVELALDVQVLLAASRLMICVSILVFVELALDDGTITYHLAFWGRVSILVFVELALDAIWI